VYAIGPGTNDEEGLDFVGDATTRAVITSMKGSSSSSSSSTHITPKAWSAPEVKRKIEVMSFDQVVQSSTTTAHHRPALVAHTARKTEEVPVKKKIKSEGVQKTTPMVAVAFTQQQLKPPPPPQQQLPVTPAAAAAAAAQRPPPTTHYVRVVALPLDVSQTDVRTLFSGLKFSNLFVSFLGESSDRMDVFIQFELKHGVDLALLRNGEQIRVRRSDSQRCTAKIETINFLESVWMSYCSLRLKPTVSGKALHALLAQQHLSADLWKWTQCEYCHHWLAVVDHNNVFETTITDESFVKSLVQYLASREIYNVERIIRDAMLSAVSTTNTDNTLSPLQARLNGLASSMVSLQRLECTLASSCSSDTERLVAEVVLDWVHRVRHLMQSVYMVLWKIQLMLSIHDMTD
jgi:hypothetical protein